MRQTRGARSVPSLNLRHRGRAGRLRESADIAAAEATMQAHRRFVTVSRREGGDHWYG